MPEGPEIKIITNWLDGYTKGTTILDCPDEYPLNSKSEYKKVTGFRNLIGKVLSNVTCKGKQIFFHLCPNPSEPSSPSGSLDFYLNSRLALEGKWSPNEGNNTRFWIKLNGLNSEHKMLYFDDSMNYGGLDLLNVTEYNSKLDSIGPDLLSDNIPFDFYKFKIKGNRIRNKQICDFLMEQSYFSGIGNYLKCEILYECKIRPDKKLCDLPDQDVYNLWNNSIRIIKLSYQHGGLTIKTFWSPEGNKGIFPKKIYGNQVDSLGNPIIKETFKDKRVTHWVPNIQK